MSKTTTFVRQIKKHIQFKFPVDIYIKVCNITKMIFLLQRNSIEMKIRNLIIACYKPGINTLCFTKGQIRTNFPGHRLVTPSRSTEVASSDVNLLTLPSKQKSLHWFFVHSTIVAIPKVCAHEECYGAVNDLVREWQKSFWGFNYNNVNCNYTKFERHQL